MTDESSSNDLVMLITRHQRRIFSYIYTIVPHVQDAEDLLQETNRVICDKFHEYRAGSDFVAWACQIAWWRIRASRQRFARSKVIFDERVMESVAETASAMPEELDHRHEALENCLRKLPPRDRELVAGCYAPGGGIAEAARRSGRSVVAAYKALGRIRKLLFDCVTYHLNPGSSPSP